jgi:hypothetical protein
MAEILGMDCKAYRNTGTVGSPTWDLIECIKDLTVNLDHSTTNVTTRGSGGWEMLALVLKQGSIDAGLLYDTEDTDFQALMDAWTAKTKIHMSFMDGPIATVGSQGLRAMFQVQSFPREEPLEGDVTVASKFIICRGATPAIVEIAS